MLLNSESLQRQYAGRKVRILKEMYDSFVASLAVDLPAMENGLNGDNTAGARQAAHSIAGAAAVLGLELLRKNALGIEVLIHDGDLDRARAAWRNFPAVVSRSVETLKEFIAGLAARSEADEAQGSCWPS